VRWERDRVRDWAGKPGALFADPKRLNPKNRIISVFLDGTLEKCEKIRV
jgi:hypothetical protein